MALERFSEFYCSWFHRPYYWGVCDLPFGLVLKRSERVTIGEAVAMQMTRAAGMPVPKVISLGEHPGSLFRCSILMTRLPGSELDNTDDESVFEAWEQLGPWTKDLRRCLEAMPSWKSPYGEERICSAIGTSIQSSRVPHHRMGPFNNDRKCMNIFFPLLLPIHSNQKRHFKTS